MSTVQVMGHIFHEPTKEDWEAYGGMNEGSMICHVLDVTMIYDVENNMVVEIGVGSSCETYERTWSVTNELYSYCGVCGRTLTNHKSIDRGIGPICAGRMGWVCE